MKVLINSKGNIVLFRHMNAYLVDGYKRKGKTPTMAEHAVNFEQTHGVKLVHDSSGVWKHIEFASEQGYLMAVMKWAS